MVEVGKRGGCRSTPLAFIERLILRLARGGQVVARLKGGDPFIFGRGGEEMLALRRVGIEYEVVPGITAGMAVPAICGIPVTHRALARGVTFVTGHGSDGAAPDWKHLADPGGLHGKMHLAALCASLLAAGMPPNMPGAVVEQGTWPSQREIIGTITTLPLRAAAEKFRSPAIIVIGDVVALAHSQRSEAPSMERAA